MNEIPLFKMENSIETELEYFLGNRKTFSVCLRLRNIEIKYMRKIGIFRLKTALYIRPTLYCIISSKFLGLLLS